MATTTTKPKKPKSKKKATTDLAVAMILDRSGSMGGLEPAVINGFNEYVADLRKQDGDTFLSLTLFDTTFEQPYVGAPLDQVGELNGNIYYVRGMTALYDAIAWTVKNLDAQLKAQGRDDAKVLIVTMTDGQENSSTDYNAQTLEALVKEYEATGRYTFTYVGLGQSAQYVSTQSGLGYSGQNGYFAAASVQGVSDSMSALSAGTYHLRSMKATSSANLLADAGVQVAGVGDVASHAGVTAAKSSLLDALNGGNR